MNLEKQFFFLTRNYKSVCFFSNVVWGEDALCRKGFRSGKL